MVSPATPFRQGQTFVCKSRAKGASLMRQRSGSVVARHTDKVVQKTNGDPVGSRY
jgi:hypothetical protein